MKILVISATPVELNAIKLGIKSANLKTNLDIDFLCCGIGSYETISSLENYLTEKKEPIFIWNIGICGYLNPKHEEKSEPIQVSSVVNVHTEKEMIIPPFLKIAPLKTCFSSENIIIEKPIFKRKIGMVDDEMYFDMESRGIEFVASRYKYPRLILKVPFDFIGDNENVRKNNYRELSEKIDGVLKCLPYCDYIWKIINWINKQ